MENNLKQIRWKQRFENLEKAFFSMKIWKKIKNPSQIEKQWIVQWFEFTFELSWKTLKDFLEYEWFIEKTPRETIKEWFKIWIIDDWKIWIDMLKNRNELSHIYNEQMADKSCLLINSTYFDEIEKLYIFLKYKI